MRRAYVAVVALARKLTGKDMLFVVGLASLAIGAWMAWTPLGFVAIGAILLYGALR